MAFGMGALGLPPAAFWTMTLKELAAVMRGMFPSVKNELGRARLGELMARFPD